MTFRIPEGEGGQCQTMGRLYRCREGYHASESGNSAWSTGRANKTALAIIETSLCVIVKSFMELTRYIFRQPEVKGNYLLVSISVKVL